MTTLTTGAQSERSLAFVAYRAALDREEHAAREFHECTARTHGAQP
jgi:hypothetical protein